MDYLPVSPDARLDFQHDWSQWLAPGDSISTRLWSIEPAGPELTNETSEVVIAEGFTAGVVYRLSEAIVTAAGLEASRTIVLRCDRL